MGSAAVETRTSEVATNVTPQQIENLPQNDRNFLNFAALAPGVSLSTDRSARRSAAARRAHRRRTSTSTASAIKNDVMQGGTVGQDASRGNPFPQNAVQEFRVITQNYSAEYAKASSAIITAVTKSGSNELKGDAFVFYQDKGLVGEEPVQSDIEARVSSASSGA